MDHKAEYNHWLNYASEDGIKEILEGYDETQIEDVSNHPIFGDFCHPIFAR